MYESAVDTPSFLSQVWSTTGSLLPGLQTAASCLEVSGLSCQGYLLVTAKVALQGPVHSSRWAGGV